MARSLGTLTIDLILKHAGFKEGLNKAGRELDTAQRKIASLQREGARLADTLRTPFEKLQDTLKRYNELLAAGAIDQQTYERAVKAAAAQFDASNASLQKHNALLAEGAKVTAATVTPLEQYRATTAKLNEMLAAGAISQETYNRAIANAKAAYQSSSASAQLHNKLLAEGRALTLSLRTPQEQLTASLAKYDAMLKTAAIDQTTYNRAVGQAHANFRSATTGASSFGTAIGKARGFLLGFGLPLTAIGISAILTRSATAAIKFGDEIQKATAKTGIGAEAISSLAFAAKQNDIELEGLTTALKRMQVNLSEIASSGKANDTLTALGLTIQELKALAPEQQFELLADRISQLQDPADRTRAAVDLFGRAGADLLPLFEQGAAGIRALREEAERMGATLTGEQARALAETEDSIKRLGQAWSGLARTLTASVAPALTKVFNILANANQTDVAAARLSEIDALLKSRGTVPGQFFPDDAALRAERDRLEVVLNREKAEKRIAALSRGGGSEVLARATDVPGFKPEEAAAKAAAAVRTARVDPAPYLREIAIDVQRITVGATEQMYRGMDEATQTSMERQLAEWEEFTSQVQALVDAGRISHEEALRRNAEKTDEYLQEIEITAERMVVPVQEAIEETSEFAKQAARNMQDAFADFLFDPFEDGLEGMLENFSQTLRRMAAEAVAANLAEKFKFEELFSGGGFGRLFGGGGGEELAPIDITASRLPEAGGAAATATALTTAGTTTATALTTAGTTSATALSTAGSTGAAALTTAGTTMAGAITAAGASAAAAIAAAGAGSAAASGLSEIAITAVRMEKGGYLAPGKAALVGESASRQAAPELLVAGKTSPTAALQALQGLRPSAAPQRRVVGLSTTGREAPELIRAGPSGITVVPLRERLERERFQQVLTRHDGDSVRLERTHATTATEKQFREWLKERERERVYFSTHYVGKFEKGGYIPPGKLGTVGDSSTSRPAPEVLIGGRVDARERSAIVAAAMPLSVARPPSSGRPVIVGESRDGRERPQIAFGGAAGITVVPLKESRSSRYVERLIDRVLPAPTVTVDARSSPVVRLDRARFAGFFAQGGYIPPNRFGVVGEGASRELLLAGQVGSPQAGKAPTIIHQTLVVNAQQGQVSRQTEMQLTAAAARGARVADRHNN